MEDIEKNRSLLKNFKNKNFIANCISYVKSTKKVSDCDIGIKFIANDAKYALF